MLRLALPPDASDSDSGSNTDSGSDDDSVSVGGVAEWPERHIKALLHGRFSPSTCEVTLQASTIVEGCPATHAWLAGCRFRGTYLEGEGLQGGWSLTTPLPRRPPLGLGQMRVDPTRLPPTSDVIVTEDGLTVGRPDAAQQRLAGGASWALLAAASGRGGGVVTAEVCPVPPVPYGPDDPRYVIFWGCWMVCLLCIYLCV